MHFLAIGSLATPQDSVKLDVALRLVAEFLINQRTGVSCKNLELMDVSFE